LVNSAPLDAFRTFFTHPESLGPWLLAMLFFDASLLMIWRLEHLSRSGVEGTVLGTLVMPYCSGIGNLIFVFVVAQHGLSGAEVVTNSLVNNVTNMTLLIGLPAVLWDLNVGGAKRTRGPKSKSRRGRASGSDARLDRLSMLLTLTAVLFFTGAVWALGRDGRLDFGDGLVLVGLFLFWQCFHVFDVLKKNVRENKSLDWHLAIDVGLLLVGGYFVYLSVQGLVECLAAVKTGFVSVKHLGWLSGWLMVLPNAVLAFYYGWRHKPEVIYTSQVGDGHICIPLCVGISALVQPLTLPRFFNTGIALLGGAVVLHFLFVAFLGRLPRAAGWVLVGAYALFLYQGLLG
jgi:cation:H+ antiporter